MWAEKTFAIAVEQNLGSNPEETIHKNERLKLGAHILIVEDEPAIIELLQYTLRQADFEIALAESVQQAQDNCAKRLPDLVLLDWMLPDKSGIHFLQQLRQDRRTQNLPVILLTAKGAEEDKINGLDSGADDYITKPFSPRELVSRIHALLRRKTPQLGHQVLRYASIVLDTENYAVHIDGNKINIGQAEFKLLQFFLAHPERVFSRTQLLDKVWGDHVFIEERTIDVHILRLRKALGQSQHLLQTVRGVGYRLSEENK